MIHSLSHDPAEISEQDKLNDKYLFAEIDNTINGLCSADKTDIQKAYDIRNGIRRQEDFEYLWKAYGIEMPGSFRHIPTLRSVFDSLVGQYINRPFLYQVSCSDQESIKSVFEEYRDAIINDYERYYQNQITAAQYEINKGGNKGEQAKIYLQKLQEKYQNGGFVSSIEKDAKNVLEFAIQRFKVRPTLISMFYDWHTAGQAYYQVKVEKIGQKPIVKDLNPKGVFFTKGPNTRFIKECDRVVIRERITVTEVWTRYGHKMTEKQREEFLSNYSTYIIGSEMEIMAYEYGTVEGGGATTDGYQKGINVPLVDVDYVEWKANTKIPVTDIEEEEFNTEGVTENRRMKLKTRYKYRLDRFQGTRIMGAGCNMYIDCGRDKFAIRDPDDPSNVYLSVNGACYNDRNGVPYMLPLKLKDIADKIDILYYHAENLTAMSGTQAARVDYPDIPVWMGDTPQERIMTWLGYLKQGLAVHDTSQQGAGQFNNSGSVDLSLSDAIITLYDMIDRLEGTAYKIVGTNRQSIGNITQTDGKGTTEIAIQGAETVTQPLFSAFDELAEQFLTDIVNACRLAYKKGLQGELILGSDGQRVFSIKSEKFNLAHFNVYINNQGFIQRDLDNVKVMAEKLVDAQLIDADVAIDAVTAKSLTQLKQSLKASVHRKQNDQNAQMSQQLEEATVNQQKLQQALDQLQAKVDQAKQLELQYKQQNDQANISLKERELTDKQRVEAEKLRLENKRVDLEMLQLGYGNTGNKEIRNN